MKTAKEEALEWIKEAEAGLDQQRQVPAIACAKALMAIVEVLEQLLAAPNADDHADQAIKEEIDGTDR